MIAGDYDKLTIDNTVGGIPLSVSKLYPSSGIFQARCCEKIHIQLETAQIRFLLSGVAPTSTQGMLMDIGDVIIITDYASLYKFKAIRTGDVSGVLNVTYFYET